MNGEAPAGGPGGGFRDRARAKIAGLHQARAMDIEHVNSIGSLLADLSARTEQLRGYL